MKAVTADYKICERKQTKTYFQLVILYKLACLQKNFTDEHYPFGYLRALFKQ